MDLLTSPTLGFLIKLLTPIAGAAFGVLGLGAKARDADGHLTRQGKISLMGLVTMALLASAAQVYEFFGAQARAEVERARAHRLLLSVQRGIYPLRGAIAEIQIILPRENAPIAGLQSRIRKAFERNRTCQNKIHGERCDGFSSKSPPAFYNVDSSSMLFPVRQSEARQVLENLQVFVALYSIPFDYDRVSTGYNYLGRFYVNPRTEDVAEAKLIYDFDDDRLRLRLRVSIDEKDLAASGVYSLADITPGAVFAYPTVLDDRLCGEPFIKSKCDRLVDGLSNTVLDEFQLRFAFPKTVRISGKTGPGLIRCNEKGQNRVAISLPDIDLIDALGNIRRQDAPPLPLPPCENQQFDKPIIFTIPR